MKTSLVILAAGLGSRFGAGIKQLTPVGASGELIIDYSIYDALAAGFDKVIFIIRRSIEEDFKRIAKIMLNDLKNALGERNISFAFTDKVCDYVAKESFSKKFGARNMRRYIQTEIEDKLAEAMIFVIKGNISMASVSIKDGKIKVDCV